MVDIFNENIVTIDVRYEALKTVKDIEKELIESPLEDIDTICESYKSDSRATVQKLIAKYQKKKDDLLKEKNRIEAMRVYEKKYDSCEYICGIDEAGRGPLAGPVVAGAIILPKNCSILYVNDSKQLSEKKREELYDVIMEKAISVGVGIISPEVIDEINILQATYEAMRNAVKQLTIKPQILLNDAVTIPNIDIQQEPIIKGDCKSISIAAASIIAKVTRDRMMREYSKLFPEYDFDSNKGYGSAKHIEALKKYGATPIHRSTFIKNFVTDEE